MVTEVADMHVFVVYFFVSSLSDSEMDSHDSSVCYCSLIDEIEPCEQIGLVMDADNSVRADID